MKFKVGTRGSKLSVTQTQAFLRELQFHERDYELVIVKTAGDIRQEERFIDMGLKGIFTKELDEALLEKRIDFAVHSLKDLPSKLHEDIHLVSVSHCLDPRDAFLSTQYSSFEKLPSGAVVGSSSARRRAQILSQRKDLIVKELRGNVETRIQKMQSGQYDAILLAAAGVKRMGMDNQIRQYLNPEVFVPCICQGIVAVTALKSDDRIEKVFKKKQNSEDMIHALILREFMLKAEGGCSIPLGAHLTEESDIIRMWGYLSDPDGAQVIQEQVSLPSSDKFMLVNKLLEKMHKKGFQELIEKINHGNARSQK